MAWFFARIKEQFPGMRIVQAGIRTMNPAQRKQAERFGVEVIDMHAFRADRMPEFTGPVYLSLDMDALDPAFAPGVSHHEPGGMSTRDALTVIRGLRATLVGADIVEYNPTRDINDMTAMVAAKFVKEIAAKMMVGCDWGRLKLRTQRNPVSFLKYPFLQAALCLEFEY